MKNKFIKISALTLSACMVIGLAPINAHASATSGVSNKLWNNVKSENEISLYAGVTGVFSDFLFSQAEVNANNVVVVASAEEDSEYDSQMASEAAKVDAEDVSNLCVARVDDFVYVRKQPTTDSKAMGKLYKKNVGTVLSEENGWYKIESGNLRGYVSADYVVVGNGSALAKAGTRFATVNTETLRVRKKASTESEILGLVPGGEDVVVLDEKEGWVKVSIEEGKGWVSTDYVSLKTEYTHGETNKEEKARLKKEEAERRAAQAAADRATSNGSSSSSSSDKSYDAPSGGTGASVARYACQFVGNPYVWGGTSLTHGADCSGFVMSVYRAFGVSLPHSSSALRSVGRGVSTGSMQPGDIVCYSGHVAIYIGNNSIVHASNHRDGIKISSPVNYRSILAVRRIF